MKAEISAWQLTGSTEALEQARISSFSGTVGGIAFAANMIDQEKLGPSYPGVFTLSQDVFRESRRPLRISLRPRRRNWFRMLKLLI